MKKDFLMGDAIKTNESFFNLNVDIKGTSPLENIKIFDGLKLIENINPFEISTKKGSELLVLVNTTEVEVV